MKTKWLILLASLVVACGDEVAGPGDGAVILGDPADTGDTFEPGRVIELSLGVEGVPVLDPRLMRDDVVLRIGGLEDGCAAHVSLTASDGQLRDWPRATEPLIEWDGRDADGNYFDPGVVDARVVAECDDGAAGAAATALHVVRLGVTAVDFTGTKSGGHVTGAFHRLDVGRRGLTVIDDALPEWVSARPNEFGLSDLDDEHGEPRVAPEPWLNPEWPPWNDQLPATPQFGAHSVPAVYVAGSRPEVVAIFGESAQSQASGIAVNAAGPVGADVPPPIRTVLAGYDAQNGGLWDPGGSGTYIALDGLPETLGYDEIELHWTFEVELDGGWHLIDGEQVTRHGVFLVAGSPELPDATAMGGSPPVAWFAVLASSLDQVTGIEGTDHFGVMDALRDRLHEDPALLYDPSERTYCNYEGDYIYWDWITFDMSEWLDRTSGYRLYCHSLACLLSSHANHWGVPAGYVTIGEGMETNLTRAAGTDTWRRWSFRSHGVAGIETDDGYVVWDAAVDIDSDDEPTEEPVWALSPKGMPLQDYLDALTPSDVGLVNEGRCFVF